MRDRAVAPGGPHDASHAHQPAGRAQQGHRSGYIIAYPDCCDGGKLIADNFGNIIPMAIVVGSVYILINLSLSTLASYVEGRQRRRGLTGPSDNIALKEAA
jgi:hypothetical protein